MRNDLRSYFKYIAVSAFATTAISCAGTGGLKKGEKLYTGAKIDIVGDSLTKAQKSALKDAYTANLTPKPNASILGMRPKVFFYNLAGDVKKEKGFRYWLKNKVGQKPVLISDVDMEFNKKIIVNYSENKGYFNATAKSDTIAKSKTAEVKYTVKPKNQYLISNVKFPADSSLVNKEMRKFDKKTLLKVGNPFDLDVIKAERERIDTGMKEDGFYYFSPDNIIVQADSTVAKNHKVELIVRLKDNTPEVAKSQWTIDKVVVFPDYNMRDVRQGKYKIPMNTDSVKPYDHNMYVIDPHNKFKPKIFDRTLYFEAGDLYNRYDHNLSLNRLINLGTFKFVKNEFVVSDSLNHKFDAYYILTPRQMQSLRLETLGKTNSANYSGGEINLNWTHRNIFKAAEQLKISAYGSLNVQMGGGSNNNSSGHDIYTAGLRADLAIPRLITPFKFSSSSAFVPRTTASIGYEFQRITQQYTLHNFTSSFGYNWKENARKEHQLNIFNLSVVSPHNVTPEYQMKADSFPALKRAIQRQLIFGPSYSYSYTNTMLPLKSTIYYKGTAEFAGTIAGLVSGANAEQGKVKSMFGIPFSQFARMEHDFRWYYKLSDKQSLATRAIFGIAYPYGNSEYIPYTKQFFVGGSNSIRAFRARTLGPGSFDPRTISNVNYLFNQSGDLKLEMNAEYRANLYKFLNVAAFVDAGNVWLINKDQDFPGGTFNSKFYNDIAVGAGVGLRLDFSIVLLRLDLAMPLRVPYYPEGDRWMFDKVNFGSSQWRKDNLILNIAIGYPF